MEELYYTIYEFAEKLRLHHLTIRRAIKNGRIQATRIGRKYHIPASEINRIALVDMKHLIEQEVEKRLKERLGE